MQGTTLESSTTTLRTHLSVVLPAKSFSYRTTAQTSVLSGIEASRSFTQASPVVSIIPLQQKSEVQNPALLQLSVFPGKKSSSISPDLHNLDICGNCRQLFCNLSLSVCFSVSTCWDSSAVKLLLWCRGLLIAHRGASTSPATLDIHFGHMIKVALAFLIRCKIILSSSVFFFF